MVIAEVLGASSTVDPSSGLPHIVLEFDGQVTSQGMDLLLRAMDFTRIRAEQSQGFNQTRRASYKGIDYLITFAYKNPHQQGRVNGSRQDYANGRSRALGDDDTRPDGRQLATYGGRSSHDLQQGA